MVNFGTVSPGKEVLWSLLSSWSSWLGVLLITVSCAITKSKWSVSSTIVLYQSSFFHGYNNIDLSFVFSLIFSDKSRVFLGSIRRLLRRLLSTRLFSYGGFGFWVPDYSNTASSRCLFLDTQLGFFLRFTQWLPDRFAMGLINL